MIKVRKLSLILFMTVALFLTPNILQAEPISSTAEVDSDIRTLKEIYTSTDPEKKYDFPENRKFEDWKGELKSVTYEIINIEHPEEPQVLQEVVEFSWSETMPEPESTLVRNGLTYYLTDVEIIESPRTGRKETLSSSVRYYGYMNTPEAEEQITAEYTDPVTGERIEASLPLKSLEVEGYSWRDDVTFELYVEDPAAAFYELGGKKFEMGQLPGEEDHTAILELLTLDPMRYRIENMGWSEMGRTVIRGVCSRYAADYVAYYEADVPLSDLTGYIGSAVYEAQTDAGNDEILYTIQASAVYKKVDGSSILPVAAGGAVTGGVIFIVLLGCRKKKKIDSSGNRKNRLSK